MANPLKVPEVTFEQAIALTQSLLSSPEVDTPEVAAVITDLVKTESGARGFFATYLTSSPLADAPSTAVIQALQSNPEVVADLLAKNLAMSAAQAVFHYRHHKPEMAQASERVRDRTARLIKLVNLNSVNERCQQLLASAATGKGKYQAFLERWGYDAEQRQVIYQALQQVISEVR